jgi:hypothetical protein
MNKTTISHGPFIGDLTESQVKVWFRVNEVPKTNLILRLFEKEEEVDFREIEVKELDDCIGLANFTSLKPGIEHKALLYLKERVLFKLIFKTKDEQKRNLHFVFGSCRYNHWQNSLVDDAEAGDKTFVEILKTHKNSELDFTLFLGDQIYADPTYSVGISESFSDFSKTYQDAFKLPNFQDLLSKVPSYMILRDRHFL